MMQELRANFYKEVYERNILNAFNSLCEAGYQYKFLNVVWESDYDLCHEIEESLVDEQEDNPFE